MFHFTPYDLRRHSTDCEIILWNYLRARLMLGLKFRRQHPLGPYVKEGNLTIRNGTNGWNQKGIQS